MSTRLNSALATGLVILLWITGLVTAPVRAQLIEETESWQDDQSVDAIMQTLVGPVWQPVWFTPRDRRGVPLISPLYKQQPPAAQQDFRPPPAPEPKPKPVPEPEPEPGPDPCAVPNPPKECFG